MDLVRGFLGPHFRLVIVVDVDVAGLDVPVSLFAAGNRMFLRGE